MIAGPDSEVSDVMTREVVTIGRNDTLLAADRCMKTHGIRHLVVLDDDGRIAGVLSRRDLFRGALANALGYGSVAQDKLFEALLVKDAMSEPVVTATPDTTLRDAARVLLERRIGCLPIVHGATLAGVLTEGDFVRLVSR